MNLKETLRSDSEGNTSNQSIVLTCTDMLTLILAGVENETKARTQLHLTCRFRAASPFGPSWVGVEAGYCCHTDLLQIFLPLVPDEG